MSHDWSKYGDPVWTTQPTIGNQPTRYPPPASPAFVQGNAWGSRILSLLVSEDFAKRTMKAAACAGVRWPIVELSESRGANQVLTTMISNGITRYT